MNTADRIARLVAWWLMATSVGVLVGTALVGLSPALRARVSLAAPASAAYASGDLIDVPRQYLSPSQQTLVVFVSGTCGASLRSAAVLGGLVERLKTSRTRVVVFSPAERSSDQASLARRMGLDRAELVPIDLTQFRVRVVPTAVLVDRDGRVRFTQEGAPGLVEEEAILAAVSAAESTALAGA